MQLASIFQDGAILQRNTRIPVWGKTIPNTTVTGVLNGSSCFCRSSATGDFTLYFPEQSAGGPYTMKISAGDESVEVKNILIGDLYLASGQSNMEYQLNTDSRADKTGSDIPLSREQEKEFFETVENLERFRYFKVPKLATGCEETSTGGVWKSIDGECSAVAAWFGLYLQKNLDNVPIGIIVSAWGGTIAEAWMSQAALLANPLSRESIKLYRNNQLKKEIFSDGNDNNPEKRLKSLLRPDGENEGLKLGFNKVDFNDSEWRDFIIPGSWIKHRIAGNGCVWVRKKVQLPESWVNKELTFCSGGIDKQDISYFNGTEIGRTGTGASLSTYQDPRRYVIAGELNNSAEAVIAVRAYSACYDGSFLGNWHLLNHETGETLDINGTWKIGVELDIGTFSPKRNPALFGPGNPNTPSILFNSMIRPLIPCALAGVIWYQGESNATSEEFASDYYHIMKSLIDDWRYHFQNPELPFIMVQLAGYGAYSAFRKDAPWAYLRESQRKLAADHPNTAIATAIDCGEENDIHPQDKQTVGYRMAMRALHDIYHLDGIVPGGPELLRATAEGAGCVRLDFAWSDGLRIDDEAEQAFYVSGDKINFVPAEQSIVEGNSVVLKHSGIAKIAEVRYAWSDLPSNTLYNGDGFAASPFAVGIPADCK